VSLYHTKDPELRLKFLLLSVFHTQVVIDQGMETGNKFKKKKKKS